MLNKYLTLSLFLFFISIMTTPALAQEEQPQSYAATQLETRLSSIEEQMRSLTGKVEQVDYMLRRMDQVVRRMQEDYEIRFAEIEKNARQSASIPVKAAPPPPAEAEQQESSPAASPAETPEEAVEPTDTKEPVVGTLGSVKVRDGKVTGGVVAPKTPNLPKTPADYGLTEQELYDHAFNLLRQADYPAAEAAFQGFLEKYPQSKLVSNAKYWYSETFYVRGKYGDAAIAFAEAYQLDPKGAKAPDSLLKLAMSLGSLNKKKDACGALAALSTKHPKAAKIIRQRAAQEGLKLKCE